MSRSTQQQEELPLAVRPTIIMPLPKQKPGSDEEREFEMPWMPFRRVKEIMESE